MKRSLIRQGGSGLVFYVPKKWVDKHELKPGDTIEVEEIEENLQVSVDKKRYIPKEIILELPHNCKRERSIQTYAYTSMVNVFRAGFDVFWLHCDIPFEYVNFRTERYLIGCEATKIKDGVYKIESLSEVNYDNFGTIVDKQFHFISQILQQLDVEDITDLYCKVERHDGYIKRGLSKGVFNSPAMPILWGLQTNLCHIGKHAVRLQNILFDKKRKFIGDERKLHDIVCNTFEFLKKAHFKNNVSILNEIFNTYWEVHNTIGPKYMKSADPLIIHHLMTLIYIIRDAASSLTGVIHIKNHHKNKSGTV